jgi:pyruvate-formate lyase-activating enzyme
MKLRILLINPPIYDFSAYDFWLKPYGMLRAAGFLRGKADLQLFDFLDRFDGRVPPGNYRADRWGRGAFYSEMTAKPPFFESIPRHFRRFGLPRAEFQDFLRDHPRFDFALIQTGMTYWYLGVKEVIDDVRARSPKTKIVLGGVYATICALHARGLSADFVLGGTDLGPLWSFLDLEPNSDGMPLWDLYPELHTGVLKLADGCPFRCTYCSVPHVYPKFHPRPLDRSIAELEFLSRLGAKHVAFYDDALLFRPSEILKPFLNEAQRQRIKVNFHTPNALNARFIDRELAELMVDAGFTNFYLGFESSAYAWQKKTGGKVYSDEFSRAVTHLIEAGADRQCIHAYLIVGHPNGDGQGVEQSMRFVHALGIRLMLSEFSPIPGTPDGERCRRWIDLDEPLWHNKTAFTTHRLGSMEVNRLKRLASELNYQLRIKDTGGGTGLASGRRASKIGKLPETAPVSVS